MDRIFFRQRTPSAIEVIAQPVPSSDHHELSIRDQANHDNGTAALDAFRDQLSLQAESQRQLSSLLETIGDTTARSRQRDQAFERGMTHLAEDSARQVQILGLVQQQLDLNHEVSLRVADSIKETASALTTFATTSDRQAKAIELLATSTQARVKQADRLERALQFWMAVIAVICLLALIYALWAASRGPVVIAMPMPTPIAAPSAVPTPTPAATPLPVPPTSVETPSTPPG